MQKLRVAFGDAGSLGLITRQETVEWHDFRKTHLENFTVTDITAAQYAALTRDERGDYKGRGGWFVGGVFSNRRRRRANFGTRSMVTLDLDHLSAFDVLDIELAYERTECVVYATHSATEEKPRLRLVFPLTRNISYDDYQPVARRLASRLDMDLFDDTTFEPVRLMYLPCRASDGPDYLQHFQGDWADPDEILATYADPADFVLWPRSSRESELRVTAQKAEDPRDKPGVIGAFCREYTVHQAIEEFCPDEWELVEGDRYRPPGSTGGAPGAVVYDDGLFLYSNHETGPTAGMNTNAWDLVRLSKFGEADNGQLDVPIGQRESQKLMMDFASGLDAVQRAIAALEFADTPGEKPKPSLTYDSLMAEIGKHEDGTLDRVGFQALVRKIAAARLDATDTDHLCNQLKTASARALTKTSVVEHVRREHKKLIGEVAKEGTLSDVELMLLNEFESEYHAGGTIKRIGKRYWTFENGLWAMIDDEVVYGEISNMLIRLREERPDQAEQLVAVVQESKTSTQTRSLHGLLEGLLAAREDRDDPLHLRERQPLPVVNCWNREIQFDYEGKQTVIKHDPAHFRTTRIDTEYDAQAECPIFDEFLDHCFAKAADPEKMVEFVHELGGYVIGLSRWLKLWVLFHGETNTGKSTLAQVFTALLGDAAVERSLKMLDTQGDFRDQGLIGKLLYVDDDLDKGTMLPDGAMKRLSEEKMIQAQIKFGSDIRFIARCFPLVCSNHWPMTRDLTQAFIERTLIIPFRNPYTTDANDELKERMLRDERSGILNRFLEGLGRLRARSRFVLPPDVIRARSTWLIHANPIANFFMNALQPSEGAFVPTTTMVDWYREWHAEEGHAFRPLPRNEFYSRLEPLAGVRVTVRGVEGWRGYSRRVGEDDSSFNAEETEREPWEDG